jgi:hypothetical protein
MKIRVLISLVLIAFASVYTQAQQAVVTIDEDGHGFWGTTPLQWGQMPDPSGGLAGNVLVYTLPGPIGPGSLGDVILLENSPTNISDVIRFWPVAGGPGQVIFYSDNSDGVDELADTGWPALLLQNQRSLQEGIKGTPYNPISGDPGFWDTGVGYVFDSDAPEGVPEGGATVLLLSLSLLGLWGAKRFNRSN